MIGGRENTVGGTDVVCLVDITIFENERQVLVDGLIAEAGLERKSSEGAEPVGNDPVVGNGCSFYTFLKSGQESAAGFDAADSGITTFLEFSRRQESEARAWLQAKRSYVLPNASAVQPLGFFKQEPNERAEFERVRIGRCKLVDRLVLTGQQQRATRQSRGGNLIDGNDLKRNVGSRRPFGKAAERHQNERRRGAAALDPARKREAPRAFDDCWADNGPIESLRLSEDLLAKAFRIRIRVDPSPVGGSAASGRDELVSLRALSGGRGSDAIDLFTKDP